MSKISKKRGHVPEDKLRELASDPNGSLFHEARMLNQAAARCTEPTGERDLETYVLNTMAIECFLVHFRNLRDFLYPDADTADNRDNVIARDYHSGWLKTDRDWKPCSRNERNRVNKLLAHISYSRGDLDHGWPIKAMWQQMMQGLAEFIRSLPAEGQEWFKAWGLKKSHAAAKNRV